MALYVIRAVDFVRVEVYVDADSETEALAMFYSGEGDYVDTERHLQEGGESAELVRAY